MRHPETPSIAVVGPGAIGTTIAAALHEAGRTPILCGHTAREQLTLRDATGSVVVPGPVLTQPAQVAAPVDLVFFAVKSTQTPAAAPWLTALCSAGTVVCALQNGVEQTASLDAVAPGLHVVPSVVWFPAQAEPDGSVRLRGPVRLTLPDGPNGRRAAEALRSTRCSVDLSNDFPSIAWRKLLQNAVAGFMALSLRRAGMYQRSDIAGLAYDYLHECLRVARAEGADLGDEVPQEILDDFLSYPADLGTSILADRIADRPLEWDIRNGVVQRLGRLHRIPTPISDVIVPLLAAGSDGPG